MERTELIKKKAAFYANVADAYKHIASCMGGGANHDDACVRIYRNTQRLHDELSEAGEDTKTCKSCLEDIGNLLDTEGLI